MLSSDKMLVENASDICVDTFFTAVDQKTLANKATVMRPLSDGRTVRIVIEIVDVTKE